MRLWRPNSDSISLSSSAASKPASEVVPIVLGWGYGVAELPIADLFGHGDQLLNQCPETTVLVELLARSLHIGAGWNDPRRPRAMAGRLASLPEASHE